MKKKLLLFDGLSIANRAFYGIPLLTTKEGVYTNAVYGFLNIMLSLIEKEKPDLVGVAFDVNKPTFRHVQVATYKGTRKGMPEELRPQIPLLKEVLTALGIFTIEKEGYEADDILGTLAKMAEKDGYEVVVVSGDRDLLQITSTSIELKIPKTKQGGTEIESYRAQDVFEKYEVTPQAFIDVKGLMGDTSDNIKGVPGVGEKTAIKLIKTYGSMEKLYAEIASVTQKKLYENLMTYKEQAFESKMLATIVCDVPLTYTWQDFSYNLQLNEKSLALFKRLEFKKLIDKLPKNEGAAKAKEKVEVDGLTLEMFQKFLMQEELTLTYFYEIDRLYLAMRTTIGTGYYELHETDDQAIKSLKIFCEKPVGQLNMHGSKKFRHVLSLYGIELNKPVFDTELAAYLLAPTTATYEVATIEELLLGDTVLITQEMWLGKGKSAKKLKDIEFEERKNVLGEQTYHLANLVPLLEAELEKLQMKKLFDEIEMPLVEVLFAMEKEGIYVDQEELKVLGEKLDMLIKETEEKIYETVGERFNINSPKQLGVMLFEKLDIPPIKKTKTGYSTSAEILEVLQDKYPIVADVLDYRQYTKLKSTYVDGLLQVISEDGCIHSTFWQTVTATGRISSTEPNLQNIPIKLALGQQIRKVFKPRTPEGIFIDADYSQIELRVLAAIAEDKTFIKAFNENIDIHTLTASQVFKVPFEKVTSLQRLHAKAINFGIVYGIGAYSLADDMKVSVKEAQRYIEDYFEKYKEVKNYLDKTIAKATEVGYVETLWHRRREIPELQAKQFNMREFGKRVAMNTPIQGSAADIIKIAMIKVYQALKAQNLKSKLILTVHDEILVEGPNDEREKVMALVKEKMEHAVELIVPLEVEVSSGKNWMEAK